MENFWDILSTILVIGFMATCTVSVIHSDNSAEKICNETQFFKITNKDYKDTGNSIISDSYNYVIYFNRYDANKNIIKSRLDLDKVTVTKYEYEILEVGILYHKSKVNIRTYGYN